MSLEFLVHPGVRKGCEPVNCWTPHLPVLVCPVNSIHYHNDPLVCSAGEARSGNGHDCGRQEWRKCHGKHSCHILLWSHQETCRDLSLVNKKKSRGRERKEGRKERKRHTQRMLEGWETLGQMKGDLKPLATLKEQRKEGVSVCLFWELHIHIYVYTNVFVFIWVQPEDILWSEKHDGNPFLAMLAARRSVCSLLWVRLKNLNNYLVDRHKILTFNVRVNVGIVCFCKSQICWNFEAVQTWVCCCMRGNLTNSVKWLH